MFVSCLNSSKTRSDREVKLTVPYSRRRADDQGNYQRETMVFSVILCNTFAGHITLYEHGFCQFHYDSSCRGPSLSVRMPLGNSPFGENVVRPWVEGLLPDNVRVREAMVHSQVQSHEPV